MHFLDRIGSSRVEVKKTFLRQKFDFFLFKLFFFFEKKLKGAEMHYGAYLIILKNFFRADIY